MEAIVGLVIGAVLIVFRKTAARRIVQIQLRQAKPAQREEFEELKETGVSWVLYRIAEVAIIVCGIGFIALSLLDLIR